MKHTTKMSRELFGGGSVLLLIIALSGNIAAQTGTWVTEAPMPTGRWQSAVGVINDILYVAGGYNPSLGGHIRPVEAYNPSDSTWTTKANRPTVQTSAAFGVIDTILYTTGGTDCCVVIPSTFAYNPTTDTWTTKASMATARTNAASGVINGLLYVVGGSDASTLSSMEAYDPVANGWTTKAPMPTARSSLGAGVIDGILYAVGGNTSSGVSAAVEAYDPGTNTWTTKSPMPMACYGVATGVINGKLYVVGGYATGYRDTAEVYDPITDTWTSETPMLVARAYLRAGVINGVLYAVGGFNSSGTALATVEAFTPSPALPITLASFTAEFDPNGRRVLLEWMTVTEVNNYGFFVERRAESEANFTTVPNSFIPGHGTTIEPQYYSFVDTTLTQPSVYYYRLRQVDLDGSIHYTQSVSVNVTILAVLEREPQEFRVHQNYPNPFNPSTQIRYEVPRPSSVLLRVYDLLGQEVATLVNEAKQPGRYEVQWNAERFSSGVYFYRLQAGDYVETKKLLLLK